MVNESTELTAQTQTPPASETTPNTTETVKNPDAVLSKNRELLGKNKSLKEELDTLREFKQAQELKEKEAKGDYQAVIDSLRNELEQTKEKSIKTQQNLAFNTFSEQVKSMAREEGCVNADKMMALMTKEQMKSVEIGEDLTVNRDDVKRLIDTLKVEHEDIGLFTKKHVNINNVTGVMRKEEPKTISTMSKSDLEAELRNRF